MKICLLTVGETHQKWASQGEEEYAGRIKHYIAFEKICVGNVKKSAGLTEQQQKEKEGKSLLAKIQPSDYVVALDERGKEMTSRAFSEQLQGFMNRGVKRVVFVVGGPYGFSQELYDRADALMSLSKMTFPHDLVRTVFVEQLYRAFTLLNGEPYHHD